jgi:hypothetical protein
MYLWKYWRESRIVWGIGILVLAAMTALSFKDHGSTIDNPRAFAGVMYVLLFATAAPLALFAWAMGSFGVGRSLGEGAGAFLLTRPERRAWFVWRDWGAGLAIVALFIVLTNMVEGAGLYRGLKAGGAPVSQIMFHGGADYRSLVQSLGLNAASIFLFCGLVFGMVYLLTIVLKNALGIVVGGGVLAGYVILSAILEHYTGYRLPELLLRVLVSPSHGEFFESANSLGISMAARAAVVLLFPVTAQLVLERSDI